MIPKWLEKRHKILYETYQNSPFRFEDAAKLLNAKMKDSEDQINVFLSELRKRGWLEVEFDPEDARKRIYRLKSREEIISETFSITRNQLTRGDLESLLKGAADLIRTRVDYAFILVLLFYKRISDKWEMEFEKA
ncbi:MAG: SAM-dependent DNA methyltransferase, partial [Nitrospirota bacterium]|nr:SAM-dependent DNA methyltransferase [Nitrospirota bacterium]